jgi:transcription antitermination factor NusG
MNPGTLLPPHDRKWYAVYTAPQHESSVLKHLEIREVESFLPTYETVRIWKNRQKMKIALPLFPSYLFVRISSRERKRVLESPGVLQIVGNGREAAAIPSSEIELLRSGCSCGRAEAYSGVVLGQKVRIKRGPMEGVRGTLVSRSGGMKFVLSLELINQHAMIHVDSDWLEPVEG